VHKTHLALSSLAVPVTCDTCHNKTSADGSTLKGTATGPGGVHVNGSVEVNEAFNTYVPAAFTASTGVCAVYCHSNGAGTTKVSPDWDDVNTGDCGDCHAVTAGQGLLGAHDTHLNNSLICSDCHSHDGTAFSGEHLNNAIDAPTLPAEISAVCGPCHGSAVPAWTADLTNNNCSICHGMSNSTTDGRDTNGNTINTDDQVGAHVAHLNSAKNWSADIACAECHQTTVTNINAAGTYPAKIAATGHIDTALPAELTFGTLANSNGATASYSGAPGGTCATSYCHDGSKIKNERSGLEHTVLQWHP